MSPARRLLLPVVARHLTREFLTAFLLTLAAFTTIYILAEFFDRLDSFQRHEASVGMVAQYFLFKLPRMVTEVMPFAVLVGALVGLGLLARQNEFVALRACGVSIWQTAAPLFVLGLAISAGTFAWSEVVVPYSAQRWHAIENVIKGRKAATLFTGRDVWFHGGAGFYNIERVSLRRAKLYGVTVYQLDADFRPTRQIAIDLAEWQGDRWRFEGGHTREFAPDQVIRDRPGVPNGFALPERLEDFGAVAVEPEELSYAMLRRQIKDLRRKGADASESWVDLHLKIALPAASLLMMLLAVPLAARGTRLSSFAASVGLGFVVAFGYFVVVAFTRALGQNGQLPPALAAWTGNAVFALVGGYFLLGEQ